MTTIDSRRIKHYLLDEMETREREQFEEQLLTDDDFFYEVAEAEDSLVDRYVRSELAGEELERFERSLGRIFARKEKVANAAALQQLIEDERPPRRALAAAETSGFWGRLTAAFRSPAFGLSMGGIAVIFAVGALLLMFENGRRNAEISRLQDEISNANQQAGTDLERQLAESRAKETELQTQIDGEKDVSGELTADLERERDTRRRLESEIADLRRQRPDLPSNKRPDTPIPATIAAITLRPLGSRGGDAPRINFESGANRVSVLLTLPENIEANERLSVQLNGKTIAQNLKAQSSPGGAKTLPVTIARSELKIGENKLTVNAGTKEISEFGVFGEHR